MISSLLVSCRHTDRPWKLHSRHLPTTSHQRRKTCLASGGTLSKTQIVFLAKTGAQSSASTDLKKSHLIHRSASVLRTTTIFRKVTMVVSPASTQKNFQWSSSQCRQSLRNFTSRSAGGKVLEKLCEIPYLCRPLSNSWQLRYKVVVNTFLVSPPSPRQVTRSIKSWLTRKTW